MKKILLVLTILTGYAYADHVETPGIIYLADVPAICGTPAKIRAYTEHFKLIPYNISLGREGMNIKGEPVFMVTYYMTADKSETAVTVDVPEQSETCLIYHSFDNTFNTDFDKETKELKWKNT